MKNKISSKQGFTLLELLVAISIIGFIMAAAMVGFTIVRAQSRDTMRVANISAITKALALYQNDYGVYPVSVPSTGECLKAGSGAGQSLLNSKTIAEIPSDPLWPITAPISLTAEGAANGGSKFCYYYWSDGRMKYNISYFLEFKSGSFLPGIHITSQTGTN